MKLILPNDVRRKMRYNMMCAGRREIGGMIMGEEIGEQEFRIVNFSVDTKSGTHSKFVRNADEHDLALAEFFNRTGANYRRFNYLGEWHSHPSFSVYPSRQDVHAMQDLVDGTGGVNFAVLLIVRLRCLCRFDSSVHLFVKNYAPVRVELIHE